MMGGEERQEKKGIKTREEVERERDADLLSFSNDQQNKGGAQR